MRAWSTIAASRACPMGNDCLYGKADAKGLQPLTPPSRRLPGRLCKEWLIMT